MRRSVPLFLLVAFLCVSYSDAPNSIEAENASITLGTNAGLKVYIDPVTKEFVDAPPQPGLEIPSMADDLNLSDEGLIIEDSPVSGEMVYLRGRFRHRYTAKIGDDGRHTAGCYLPHEAKKKSSDGEEE
jgi:hypothetical protein